MFKYSEGNTYLWTRPDKITYAFPCDRMQSLLTVASERNAQYADCYFSVGLSERELGRHDRAKNDDVVGIPALWVDIDIMDAAHAAENLPPDYDAARGLLPGALDPTFIVHSGHGIHVYYQFREMLDTREAVDKAQAEELLRRLQGIVRINAAAHGWHVDSVPDICRVLRVPGTFNYKNGRNAPSPCIVAEYDTDRLYNPEDFDILPPVEEKEDSGRRTQFERRDTDGPAALMMANCTFLQHWEQNYGTLPEPVWKAACTNIIRGIGGEDIILSAAKSWLGDKFKERDTLKKLQHYLKDCTPQTCQHIHQELGFTGCQSCEGVKSPCAWSLGRVPQAVARVRAIALPDAENTLNPETLGDLALLKKTNSLEYAKFEEKCKGRVNLNNLKHEVKKQQAAAAGLSVVEGGGAIQPGQKLGDVTTQQYVPDTPLNLRVPPNFSYGPNGVYEYKATADGQAVTHQAAGSPVIIGERIYNLDTQTEKVMVSFKYFGRWVPVICKRSEVFSSRTIVNMTDRGLNTSSESAKYLVRYLQALEAANPEIPLTYAVSKIGWRDNSITDFVIPSQTNYHIDLDDEGEVSEAFGVKGTLEEWKAAAAAIRKYPFARFVLAASFAAPLLKIFKNRNFMIFFWGTSGGGKTASQVFALTVWGNPGRMMKSFYATQNGIEKALAYSNDFPLVINEKQVAGGYDKQSGLEQIVYMLEGGRGKVRAGKAGMRKTSTWRSIGMASGEEPLSRENSIQGVKTRLLELNVYPVLSDDAAKTVYAMADDQYGTAGPAFIERLTQESEDSYIELHTARDALVKRLRETFPEHFSIHIDNVALVSIADMLVSQWIFGSEAAEAQQAAYDLAVRILQDLPTENEISDVERGWNFVETWLASNHGRFDRENCNQKLVIPEYGYVTNGFIHIYPEYLVDAMGSAGFSPDKLLREFADRGRIESSMEGCKRRFKIKVTRNGRSMRVIRIHELDAVPTAD